MDAMWNLEDKLKVSTEEAIVVLSCTAFLVIGICFAVATTTVFMRKYWSKNKKRSAIYQEPTTPTTTTTTRRRCVDQLMLETETNNYWAGGGVKKVLMRSVMWSGVKKMKKWEEESLLVSARFEGGGCWQSQNNSTSPVWKRPILMGEKCELPRFSGLILYDQRGRPVPVHHHSESHPKTLNYREEPAETAIVTTLRDLLQ